MDTLEQISNCRTATTKGCMTTGYDGSIFQNGSKGHTCGLNLLDTSELILNCRTVTASAPGWAIVIMMLRITLNTIRARRSFAFRSCELRIQRPKCWPSASVQLWSATTHTDQGTDLCSLQCMGMTSIPNKLLGMLVIPVTINLGRSPAKTDFEGRLSSRTKHRFIPESQQRPRLSLESAAHPWADLQLPNCHRHSLHDPRRRRIHLPELQQRPLSWCWTAELSPAYSASPQVTTDPSSRISAKHQMRLESAGHLWADLELCHHQSMHHPKWRSRYLHDTTRQRHCLLPPVAVEVPELSGTLRPLSLLLLRFA